MMKNVWLKERNEFISDEDFERIQELVDSMTVPQDIGRIRGKISCSFSGFTADQWKNWTTVYSLFALKVVNYLTTILSVGVTLFLRVNC